MSEEQLIVEKSFAWSRFLCLSKNNDKGSSYYYCIRKLETDISLEYIEVLKLSIEKVDRVLDGVLLGDFINTSTEHKTLTIKEFVDFLKDKNVVDRKIEVAFELAKKHFSKFISEAIYKSSIMHELLEMYGKSVLKGSS